MMFLQTIEKTRPLESKSRGLKVYRRYYSPMKKRLTREVEPWARVCPQSDYPSPCKKEPEQPSLPLEGLQLSLLATREYGRHGNPANQAVRP